MMDGADYFAPVALHGARTALLPISDDHVAALAAAGTDKAIWQWLPSAHDHPGGMHDFVRGALALRDKRLAVPFTTVDKVSGQVAGSTRFHFIEPEQRRLEIGVTWLGRPFQRSHVNTEAKLLQMWYAFEILGCRRIEWKTDAANSASRTAVLRLGATEEGRFRQHMIYPDGRNRDSVYYSILDGEWPTVRAKLEQRLGFAFDPSFKIGTSPFRDAEP